MSNRSAEKLLESQKPQPDAQAETVGTYVMRNLGRPSNLFAVRVYQLWEDHYRVNVLVGESVASVAIAHSYFLVMSRDGNCLSSSPAVTREYPCKSTATEAAECPGGKREINHVHAADVD